MARRFIHARLRFHRAGGAEPPSVIGE